MVEDLEDAHLDLEEVKVLLEQLGLDRKLITEQSAICILALADGREREGLLQGKKHLRDGARIHDIMTFARQDCGKEVAENTRESYRKSSLRPLCEEGLVIRHQLSTNDPKTFYRLHPDILRLMTCPAPLERRWLAQALASRLSQGEGWRQQQRKVEVPVEVGQPQPFFLSPGAHSRLTAEVVENYASRFMIKPRVVYLGDTRHKDGYQNRDLMRLVTRGLNRNERLIIILYYYEDMTMKEIGATLDLSESRVSQMHSSIVARLQAQLAQRRPEFST